MEQQRHRVVVQGVRPDHAQQVLLRHVALIS
jgi:hypothetical protein